MKRFSCILIALAMLICMTMPAFNAVAEVKQAAIPVVTDPCIHVLAQWEVIGSWYEPDPVGVKCYKFCERLWSFCLLCGDEFSYDRKTQLAHDYRVIEPGHYQCRICGREFWEAK